MKRKKRLLPVLVKSKKAKEKLTQEEAILTQEHFEDLQEVSNKLIEELVLLEKRIQVLGDKELEFLFCSMEK